MPEQCGHTGGRGGSFHSRNHFCCCGGGGAVGARSASVVRRWASASLSTGCPHGPQDADRSAVRVHGFTACHGVRSLRLRLNRRRGAARAIPRRAHGPCSFSMRRGLPASNTLPPGHGAMQGLSGARTIRAAAALWHGTARMSTRRRGVCGSLAGILRSLILKGQAHAYAGGKPVLWSRVGFGPAVCDDT